MTNLTPVVPPREQLENRKVLCRLKAWIMGGIGLILLTSWVFCLNHFSQTLLFIWGTLGLLCMTLGLILWRYERPRTIVLPQNPFRYHPPVIH